MKTINLDNIENMSHMDFATMFSDDFRKMMFMQAKYAVSLAIDTFADSVTDERYHVYDPLENIRESSSKDSLKLFNDLADRVVSLYYDIDDSISIQVMADVVVVNHAMNPEATFEQLYERVYDVFNGVADLEIKSERDEAER